MSDTPGLEGPHSNDIFSDLPAGYQQVMSPSGGAAQASGPRRDEDRRPNGVNLQASFPSAAEPDYDRALAATGIGEVVNAGSVARGTNETSSATGRPTGSGDAESGAGGAGQRRMPWTGRMSRTGTEMFRSPDSGGSRERSDGPLFPHAGQTVQVPTAGQDGGGLMWPSPLASPTTRSVNGDDVGSTTSGNVIAQQGAAAMKWLSRLGEFVQRKGFSTESTWRANDGVAGDSVDPNQKSQA